MILKKIFGPYLNWSYVDKSAKVNVRIIERPAFVLSKSEIQALRSDLKTIVKKSIPKESLDYGIFSESSDAMERSIITIIYDKENRPIAFNCLSWIKCYLLGKEENVLHLGLVVVDPDVREGGMSWILYGLTTVLLFTRKKFNPLWISNVTQVPAIIGKVYQSFDQVYPTPKNIGTPPFFHSWLVRQIMHDSRHVFGVAMEAIFDDQKFIIKNAYTGGSNHLKKRADEAQPHRNPEFNQFCYDYLNYDRGDDFIQLGQFNLKMAHLFLTKSIPRKSLLGIGIALVFLSIQAFLSPILMWFDTNQSLGDLRPWKS